MNCDQIQEHLSEYLDDRLDGGGRRAIEDHLASCPRCLPEVKLLSDAIKGVAGLPEMEPPPGFSDRVMTRIRKETEKPTLWSRLFQPFVIKIPLHATGLLLMIGLTVYLYRANAPMNREAGESAPSASAPLERAQPAETPEPIEQRGKKETPAISPPPSEPKRFADLKQSAPSEGNRPEPLSRKDGAPAAPSRVEGPMKSDASKTETGPAAGAPIRQGAAADPQGSPDIVLMLAAKENFRGTTAFTERIKEIAEHRGGKVFARIKEPDPENAGIQFWVSLPRSEYGGLKAELGQIGNVLSETQGAPAAPPSDVKLSSSIQVVVTFLLENPVDTGAPSPSLPSKK